jgi:hypothetical protein
MPLEDLDPQTPAHWPQVQLFVGLAGPASIRVHLIRTPWGLKLCYFAPGGKSVLAVDLSLAEADTFATAIRSLSAWTAPP